MKTVTTMPRASTGLTVADLDDFPDDGWRYELLDGTLLVSAAPSRAHQRASLRLSVLLHAACPPHLELLAAPFDVTLDDVTQLQPDLVVAPRAQFTEKNLPGTPLLAVEVADVSSDASWTATSPYAVTLTPAALVD
jgi:Uma2 family endonuclease